jgi:hypothetical protein
MWLCWSDIYRAGFNTGLMQTAHTFNADSEDKLKTKIFLNIANLVLLQILNHLTIQRKLSWPFMEF